MRHRTMRWCAVASCVLAGCYRPASLDCAVSCASGAPCPNGLTCGATDQLCHAGAIECSAMSFPPLVDAAPGSDAGPRSDAAPGSDAAVAYCDPDQLGLIGCYEFEGTANNAPGLSRALDIGVSNVTFPFDGKVHSAAAFDNQSFAFIEQDLSLELTRFTIETWAEQDLANTPINTTVVNHSFQYGLTLDTEGKPVCAYTTEPPGSTFVTAIAATPLTLHVWTHLACTYNGATVVLYVNGVEVKHTDSTAAVRTGADPGVHIAGVSGTQDVFTGRLDELRIFNVARSAHEICVDAGRASCP